MDIFFISYRWLLKQFNNDEVALVIFLLFFLSIFRLTWLNWKYSQSKWNQIIFTLGILGTFLGVSWGLKNFDSQDIETSIPRLLAGLKTAFFTSIWGMIAVVVCEIRSRIKNKEDLDSEQNYVPGIYNILRRTTDTNSISVNQSPHLNNALKNIDANITKIIKIREDKKDSYELLRGGFEKANHYLQNISTSVEKGVSDTIAEKLEETMRDFNDRIENNLGKNFTELNKACEELKNSVRSHSDAFAEISRGINESLPNSLLILDRQLASVTKKFIEVYEQFLSTITNNPNNTN